MRANSALRFRFFLIAAVVLLVAIMILPSVHAEAFRDVPAGDELSDAVAYLHAKGIIQGYSDGTFRPDQDVQRAEALKLIVSAKQPAEADLSAYSKSDFSDVSSDAWYFPYVEYSFKKLNIVNGPPVASSFHPARSVTKAEFFKMFLLSQGADMNANADVKLPLAPDVTDATTWYYPYVRTSFYTSMSIIGKSGTIHPERTLTRADVALLMYRFLTFREGKRTQALLSEIETEIVQTTHAINDTDVRQAEYASARALLAARGARAMAPKETIVAAALKITESYRALVRGYRARIDKNYVEAAQLSKDAWSIAKEAMTMSDSVKTLATVVQESAAAIAKEARSHL